MKYKTILFPLLMVLLFVWGCTDDVLNNAEGDTDGRVIGSVHGVVTDSYTNVRLNNITVTWASKGVIHTTKTNSLGYYAFTSLSPGVYEMTFSGSDFYAVSRTEVTIKDLATLGIDDRNTEENFHISVRTDIDLYRKNAALTGVVYAEQDDETRVVAPGVTVIADFSDQDLSGEDYLAMTDANGIYLFFDIPATSTVDLRTMPFNDGTYDFAVQTMDDVALIPNDTVMASGIIATIADAKPIMLLNNFENDDVGLSDDLTITFSKTMTPASFDITLSSIGFGNVEFVATWANNITLTINPLVTLQAGEEYTLSITGESADNNSFDASGANALTFNTIDGIEFVSTNLERVDGVFDGFPLASDITITFDMPIDINNINFSVVLEDAINDTVRTTITLSVDEMTLTINPEYNLEAGQTYDLQYVVYSNIEGDNVIGTITFTTLETFTPPGQVTGFADDEASGWLADYNTLAIDFKWSTVTGAEDYHIYAKDDNMNSDFVLIATIAAVDDVTSQTGTATLPAGFDWYLGIAPQTPFLYGTEVQYGITASNAGGESAISTLLTFADETLPTGNVLVQTGVADGSVESFTITFSSTGEYLDTAVDPVVAITDGGAAAVLTSNLVTFEWDADMKGGTFTIDNSGNADFTGDTFIVSGFDDTSGNKNTAAVNIVLN